MSIVYSIEELIGHTPLICVDRATEDSAEVVVKLEYQNPGGSVKDRLALSMIREAEKTGELKPGGVIVEATSGNTGIGLAMISAACGYRLKLTMPDSMSSERKKILAAYGAELILTPGKLGMRGAMIRAEEIAREEHAFLARQFDNEANVKVHYETTGPEIWSDTEGKLDAFVAGVGTGGTFTGTGKFLRLKKPGIPLYAVEPLNSPVLAGGQPGLHQIQGIGAGFIPSILDMSLITESISVGIKDALETSRNLCTQRGLLVGISSGAITWAARKVARQIAKKHGSGIGHRVASIIPSNGERYLSTILFDHLNNV